MVQADQQEERSIAESRPGRPRERAFYFTHEGSRLFGTLHEPAADVGVVATGWVFCSAFGEERGFSQKIAVEWARVLCAAGYWVMRFDYRGYGDSEGNFQDFTADDHVNDILAAVREFEARAGVLCRGLWGLRFGASLAVRAAERGKLSAALVLWDPVVSGEKYMDEQLRGVMAKEMANTRRAPRSRAELKQHMADGGEVIIEGHPLTHPIFQSVVAVDLLAEGVTSTRPTLVVQLAARPNQTARKDLESFRRRFAGNARTDLPVVTVPTPWRQTVEYAVRPMQLFEPSLQWIRSLDPPVAAAGGKAVAAAGEPLVGRSEISLEGGVTERLVDFDHRGNTLRGVLHLPARIDPARPAVIMATPGFNCRTARYRLYVRLARALSRRGWTCLRFDPHGIGDSDSWHDLSPLPELYNAIEDGLFVPDVRAAAEFLHREHGIGSSVLIGLCGGSIASIRAAAVEDRLVGVISSELPFRYTPKADSAEATVDDARPLPLAEADHFLRSYRVKLFEPEAWRRFLSLKSDYRGLLASLKTAVLKRIWAERVVLDDAWFSARLGPRANLSLVRDFRRCLERQVHLFCLFGSTYNSWYFSEIKPGLLSDFPAIATELEVRTIKDADPGFSLPEHSVQFVDSVVGWLEAPARPWGSAGPSRD